MNYLRILTTLVVFSLLANKPAYGNSGKDKKDSVLLLLDLYYDRVKEEGQENPKAKPIFHADLVLSYPLKPFRGNVQKISSSSKILKVPMVKNGQVVDILEIHDPNVIGDSHGDKKYSKKTIASKYWKKRKESAGDLKGEKLKKRLKRLSLEGLVFLRSYHYTLRVPVDQCGELSEFEIELSGRSQQNQKSKITEVVTEYIRPAVDQVLARYGTLPEHAKGVRSELNEVIRTYFASSSTKTKLKEQIVKIRSELQKNGSIKNCGGSNES